MPEPVFIRVPTRIDFAGGWSDVPDFAGQEGGAVLNAAIDRYVEGHAAWDGGRLHLSYTLDASPDSHLGSSSSIDGAWLRLSLGLIGAPVPPAALAEKIYQLERLLGQKGGKQDCYAAALGGINLLRFGGEDEPAAVEPVELDAQALQELAARLVLVDSGSGAGSSGLHERLWQRFGEGDPRVRHLLRALRDTAVPARDALMAADWPALGALLTRNRELARELGAGAVTDAMDGLFRAGEAAGALGAKPCGAGGGGALLFLAGDAGRGPVVDALAAAGATAIPFGFAPRC